MRWRARVRDLTGAIVVAGTLVATMLVTPTPTGAAPGATTTALDCVGADAPSTALLSAVGSSVQVPAAITPDVPEEVAMHRHTDVSFQWDFSLGAGLETLVAGIGADQVRATLDVEVQARGLWGSFSPSPIQLTSPFDPVPLSAAFTVVSGPSGSTISYELVVRSISLVIRAGAGSVPLNLACTPDTPLVASTLVTEHGPIVFPDVPFSHVFRYEIAWLAATGITTGYPDGTFRPDQPVSRQTMAAFLQRLSMPLP